MSMNTYRFEVYYTDKLLAKMDGEKIAAFTKYNDAAQYFDDCCSIAHCAIRPINGAQFPENASDWHIETT